MPKKISAGILLYRRTRGLEVFLVHPGGPFWAKKDLGAWTIPKGEAGEDEELRDAALREFGEETGFSVAGDLRAMRPLKQASGKVIHAYAVEGDCDPGLLRSNTFSMEWPPKSGRQSEFVEVDRGAWFSIEEARERILKGQVGLLDELEEIGR
jgi:predicted NUDIX family NTP pyrophosphohydrolase